jgi:FtsP/CotA-like multicopper oxidase with cupredoxin domain
MAGLGTNIASNFFLRASMGGNVTLAGNSYLAWYFRDTGVAQDGFMGDRNIPSSHIECVEGTACSIDFVNQSQMEHTIHMHGMDVDQANDGVGATSFTVPIGGQATYYFTAPHAGTYHYHCHVDTTLHYARGMYGTIIVRPPSGSTSVAWDGGPSFQEEVLWHLSTFDTSWMNEFNTGPGTARFHPDVFTLNGLETPAAKADPFTRIVANVGEKVYIRVVQCAYNWARIRFGGLPFQVIDSDGRPMQTPQTVNKLDVGPGERYGLLLDASAPGTIEAVVEFLNEYNDTVWGEVRTDIVFV